MKPLKEDLIDIVESVLEQFTFENANTLPVRLIENLVIETVKKNHPEFSNVNTIIDTSGKSNKLAGVLFFKTKDETKHRSLSFVLSPNDTE